MLKPFICGSGNFLQEEEDNPAWISSSSSSSPRRKSRIRSNSFNTNNNKNNKNPYSNRGRDKFETVLAELDERRQKIYEKYMGSQDQIEMVRFVYSNSKGWVPIVIKLRDQKQKDKAAEDHKEKQNSDNSEAEFMNKSSPITEVSEEEPKPVDSDGMKQKKNRVLVVKKNFVRSFAIICTSIFWYLMPLMKQGNKEQINLMMRRSMKKKIKKDFFRSKSEQKMNTAGLSSPR
ncbi:hypothetical protein BVC80_8915g38 [Macleaya cordata]|uniref:Uncharacterized protein n=1 Tax=Macleaya cordata TaxID=56857 RepID=A0A200QG09_MACCD|nr:hypothetical protein BVC80_8915g38 [Macleaya cordata]